MVMKRTSVWLSPRELAALRRAARLTHRTQSDLIREGVRRVTMQVPLPGAGRTGTIDTASEWFTREEEAAFSLWHAGYSIESIAQELRTSVAEAKLVLERASSGGSG